eukprot:TRINITY_DN1473_c0_g1_i1.p1 TRINITY_DN1473_c0_g1~~TRINITY_DN1473_c0_g1_i1.p1  ORF type:complete len:150 (-),score=40.36 TRINITY_DN1473_c0_g1_i1:40-459(-)
MIQPKSVHSLYNEEQRSSKLLIKTNKNIDDVELKKPPELETTNEEIENLPSDEKKLTIDSENRNISQKIARIVEERESQHKHAIEPQFTTFSKFDEKSFTVKPNWFEETLFQNQAATHYRPNDDFSVKGQIYKLTRLVK